MTAPLSVRLDRIEHRPAGDRLGVGVPEPRLSWIAVTDTPSWRQAAYEVVLVAESTGERVSSGRVRSDQSLLVPWPGRPLSSRQRWSVRVRVWGKDGGSSPLSEPAVVEAGLLSAADWTARFITPVGVGGRGEPLPLLRTEFRLDGEVTRGRLFASALGVYEIEVNGARVGDQVLAPGWTSYPHRVRYDTFDVTGLLRPGANAIGALLGDGWYRGRIGYEGRAAVHRDQLALLAQLEVTQADGQLVVVATDHGWRAAPGPLVSSDIYDGETHDARRERPGWSAAGHDDRDWSAVRVVEPDIALVARARPPTRRTETLAPVAVGRSPSGKVIVDFGQNMAGRVRLTVEAAAGHTITLRHAEVLLDGELHTAPLAGAAQTDRYTASGAGPASWEPRFTYHGFRYVEVGGWPGELTAADLRAVVCHSDLERIGWFECSDPRINRLHENIVWSLRGSVVDIPADCPQRDERLGWTGDVALSAPTSCFLYDMAGLFSWWLADLAAEQAPDGAVPHVVPNPFGTIGPATAVWGDVAIVLPWLLYQHYGDLAVLRTQYPSMTAFADHVSRLVGPRGVWDEGFQYGDWLAPDAPLEDAGAGGTDRHLLASAWRCHTLDILADTADLLGHTDDARRYTAAAEAARDAFTRAYVTPDGRLVSDTQTAVATAIRFDLLSDPAHRARAARRLAELVEEAGDRLTTGFVGTPLLCHALCDAGAPDVAYRLLLQQDCPSWLYEVNHGATTVWEAWNLIAPDGRVRTDLGPQNLGSHSHFGLGSVADWLHRTVGGLAPGAPGYRHIIIRPVPGGGLTWATARHRTPYGTAESSWRIDGGQFDLTVTVPANTAATVHLPDRDYEPVEVGSGSHHWRCRWPAPDGDPDSATPRGG